MPLDPYRRTESKREVRCRLIIYTMATAGSLLYQSISAAGDLQWMSDLTQAKDVAAAKKKDLLINFTGLTWCGPCMQLEREILRNEAFAPVADDFVCVRLDFPADTERLPQEPPPPQPSWLSTYGVRSFPTIFLADDTGKPYAATGNVGNNPTDYLKHVLELKAVHDRRDNAFAKAAQAEGIARAKSIAEGLTALEEGFGDKQGWANSDPLVTFYREEIDAVIQLDFDNSAGYRDHFNQVLQREKDRAERSAFFKLLSETNEKQGIEEALRLVNQKIGEIEPGEFRNQLRGIRLNDLQIAKHFEEAIAYARELAADESFSLVDRRAFRRRIAGNLQQLDRTDEAIAAYDQLITEVQHDDPRMAFSVMGDKAECLYWYAHRYQEALDTWDAAIKIVEPNTLQWVRAQGGRITMLARLGRVEDAWSAYDQLAASPITTPLNRVLSLTSMADEFNKHGSTLAAQDTAVKAKETFDQMQNSMVDPRDADYVHRVIEQVMGTSVDGNKHLSNQGSHK